MNAEPLFIGIDLGTSAVKVLAVTANGARIAFAAESYALETPAPLEVEQDVETLYAAAMRCTAAVIADVRGHGTVVAIGASSAMHGVVCVDRDGRPLSHAITWMDRRSTAIADGWRHDGTAAALYARTGAPMHPMLPVAKLRWLADNDPSLVARSARFVGVKELLTFRWTGEWVVDWGIAAATGLFAFASHDWDPQALALAGVDASHLSAPKAPSTALPLRSDIATTIGCPAATRLVLGSSDGALATIGSGAGRGDVVVTLGTSGAVRALAAEPLLDQRGRTFAYCADDHASIVGGPTSGAGASLDWLFALLLNEVPRPDRFARAVELAAEIAPGADGCTLLPFLSGERAPYWNASLRGTIAGLELGHDRRTILRAAFEGVVFGVRAVDAVLRERRGRANRIVVSGGLMKAPFVRGLVTDVFGVETVQPREEEAAAVGAALLAAAATGAVDDPVTVAAARGYTAARQPQPESRAAYDAAYARYRALVAAALVPA